MKKYQRQFKEWQPEVFQKARKQGIIDDPNKKSWVQSYAETFDMPVDFIKNKIYTNEIKHKDARIIIWNGNYYSAEGRDFLHYHIILHLILFKGLKLDIKPGDTKKLELYWRFSKENKLLGLQLGENYWIKEYGLYLPESYADQRVVEATRELLDRNYEGWMTVINKIERQEKVDFFDTAI